MVLFIGAIAANVWYYTHERLSAVTIDAPGVVLLSPLEKFPNLNLIDHDRRLFNNSRLQGHWTLAVFGYTSCPDFCPTTLADVEILFRRLERSPGIKNGTQFLFISVDPFRDTPEKLATYVKQFDSSFLGITGEPEQLHQLASQLGTFYEYVDPKTGIPIDDTSRKPMVTDYVVDHYSGMLVINPQEQLVATITPPFDVDRLSRIYLELRSYAKGTS